MRYFRRTFCRVMKSLSWWVVASQTRNRRFFLENALFVSPMACFRRPALFQSCLETFSLVASFNGLCSPPSKRTPIPFFPLDRLPFAFLFPEDKAHDSCACTRICLGRREALFCTDPPSARMFLWRPITYFSPERRKGESSLLFSRRSDTTPPPFLHRISPKMSSILRKWCSLKRGNPFFRVIPAVQLEHSAERGFLTHFRPPYLFLSEKRIERGASRSPHPGEDLSTALGAAPSRRGRIPPER